MKVSAETLSVEAAGNNEPLSGTNALQVRQEAQDFRHLMREVGTRLKIDLVGNGGSLLTAESLKRNCQP